MGAQFDDPNREAVGLQPITTAEATKAKAEPKKTEKKTSKNDDEE